MSEHSTNGSSQYPHYNEEHQKNTSEPEELEELRSLLLGIESSKLNHIYEHIDEIEVKPENISKILPQAIILRTMQDKQLSEAIVPTIEQAIDSSIKKDFNVLSDTIFPIIGPATRRAISVALNEMTQSLNQTLEHSLSPQSFKWRLEARQTGKSFAEVVMLRTLLYRVEQVFLIHKKTGLLLQHIVAPQTSAQDPDLISAMLTAIQDFIKDSFNVQKDEMLQTLEFGELTIWIEEGPLSVLAGIIRGSAPQELRLVFQDTIEKIHLRLDHELQTFEGETEPFTHAIPYLKNCLEARYKVPASKNYTYAYALVGLITLAIGVWGFLTMREQHIWNAAIENLESQPGITVIKTSKRNGKYIINGMRDPDAVDPNNILRSYNIKPETVIGKWEPYLSLSPEFVVLRAQKLLKPPKSVSLSFNEGTLTATGSAPRQWILNTQKSWRFIPGVTQYQENNLVDLNISQLKTYQKQLEKRVLLFKNGSTDLVASDTESLQKLATEVQRLLETAKYLGKNVKIQIIGHTSPTGGKEENLQLSQQRASKIRDDLISQGINQAYLRGIGVGSTKPPKNQKDISGARKVNLKVFID